MFVWTYVRNCSGFAGHSLASLGSLEGVANDFDLAAEAAASRLASFSMR
jgi:hypothetical protein